MKGGTILIILALFLGFLAVTGKYKCISTMLYCVFYADDPGSCSCGGSALSGSASTGGGSKEPGYIEPKTYVVPPYVPSQGTLPLNPVQQ